ncbi:hypothetical protein, partial [Streptomyces sp. BE303]|uniref:hypothetical protein n=1 Tax=Streptomyces sp. BE303 TaxID=3002528 RepID=UPI002E793E04
PVVPLPNPTGLYVGVVSVSNPISSRAAGVVPIGRPVWHTRLYVLDGELRPAPVCVPGEVYLAGVQLWRVFLGRPCLTAGVFVAVPHGGPCARMYRTGDLVR